MLLDLPVLFFCPLLPVIVAYPVWWVQEYTEEFREIAPRSKKNLGGVADGNITLINQRSVCDDLPVCKTTYLHPPLMPVIICTIFIFSLFYKSVKSSVFRCFLSIFSPPVCAGVQCEAIEDGSKRRFEAAHLSPQLRLHLPAREVTL